MSELEGLKQSRFIAEERMQLLTNPAMLSGYDYARDCLKRMEAGEQVWVDVELCDEAPTDGDRHYQLYDGVRFTNLGVVQPADRQDLPYVCASAPEGYLSLGGAGTLCDAIYQATTIYEGRIRSGY